MIDRDITRKHTYANKSVTELIQSCVKVEVAVLDSPSLIVLTVSLCECHVKQHQLNLRKKKKSATHKIIAKSEGAGGGGRSGGKPEGWGGGVGRLAADWLKNLYSR